MPIKRNGAAGTRSGKRTVDEAFIGLLIGAMEANAHTSPEEAARAHHMLWSMRRFRNRSGDTVGALIARMKARVTALGADPVVSAACRAMPKRLAAGAFATVADLVLVDGRLEPSEQVFLEGVSAELGLDRNRADAIIAIMRLKNAA